MAKTEIRYICTGICHGFATKEQFWKGAKKCSAKSCEMKGKPLVRMAYCGKCGSYYPEAVVHKCAGKKPKICIGPDCK